MKQSIKLNHGQKAIPAIGLGVFKVEDGDTVIDAVVEAIRQGYRHIDTAAVYENEEGVGIGIRKGMEIANISRDDLFITSKLWNADQGYDAAIAAYEASLERLGLEQLDLYLIHWPVEDKIVDSWRALEQLYRDGRVGAVGVSNFQAHHLETLAANSELVPAVNQVERHPLLRQTDLSSYMSEHGIVPVAWAPLMQGGLFEEPTLVEIAKEVERSVAQVILRWHLQTGWVIIPKSVKSHRIEENFNLYDFELSDEQMNRIDALDQHKRVGPDPDDFDF
ncbi:aldo/keto reductase [Exiguobacterium aestuarii]|uniref:Aldo/keto reductase n=1 Tax=Exiguobacterium aestuarii TaxID=273527 RepID=A0ABW2PJK2_9BACL|nr:MULTISPECIES: aldo/keto reductase [Exiguobacterium]MCT4786771.1 aldo/keto reductase [Exiguobacterium aestuarii]